MTKQDIIDYIMETPGNTNPAILSQFLDEIGGGGSGDFSIVTGTFTHDNAISGHGIKLYCNYISDYDEIRYHAEAVMGDGTYSIILYKGQATIGLEELREGDIISISGGIQSLGDNGYQITGDFTVHFIEGLLF